MNIFKHTRRDFLLRVPLVFGLWPRTPAIPETCVGARAAAGNPSCQYIAQPLDEWLIETRHELPSLAHAMAHFERRGVQYENPGTWYRQNYVGAVPWRPGVVLLFGFGRRRESQESFTSAEAWLERERIVSLATGWSDDRRAWTRFVLLANREKLAPIISNSIAPLSPSPNPVSRRR